MNPSRVKQKLKAGKAVLCAANHFSNPNIVELIGQVGYDCVWICNEHVGINRETLEHQIRAARLTNMDAMIRIVRGNHDDLIQPLEMGAKGLMIPRIRTAEEAARIVYDAKFAPVGMRGIDGVNPDADMGMVPFTEYLAFSNDNTFLNLQIEDADAVDRIDELASVKGIDILFIGPTDLSQSYGIPGEIQHPRILEAIKRTVAACARHGIACGTPGINPEYGKKLLDLGVRFLAGPGDFGLLRGGFLAATESWGKLGFTFEKPAGSSATYH